MGWWSPDEERQELDFWTAKRILTPQSWVLDQLWTCMLIEYCIYAFITVLLWSDSAVGSSSFTKL